MNIMKENLKVSTAFLLIFLISSCSSFSFYKVPVTQGNIFEEEDIEKLQVGQSMDQVQFILGSPMIKDPFHSNSCLLYTSPSPRDTVTSRMPSSA